jgi:hypothetical protein
MEKASAPTPTYADPKMFNKRKLTVDMPNAIRNCCCKYGKLKITDKQYLLFLAKFLVVVKEDYS